MLIWQGWGILGIVLPIVGYFLITTIARGILGIPYANSHAWPGALGTLLGAAAVWLLALKVDGPGRTLVDPQTGQVVVMRRSNTLFWIPLRYIAIIAAVIALAMLFVKGDSVT